MSTIYSWDDVSANTAAGLASGDKVFIYDAGTGRTMSATVYDFRQAALQMDFSTASAAATISGGLSGHTSLGTSTLVYLSAPLAAGVQRWVSTTSTVAWSVTASGSSFGAAATYTNPLGGGAIFGSISTLKWNVVTDGTATGIA